MIRHILRNIPYVMSGNLIERGSYFAFVNIVNMYMVHDVSSSYVRTIAFLSSLASVVHFCSSALIVKFDVSGNELRERYLLVAFIFVIIQSAVIALFLNLIIKPSQTFIYAIKEPVILYAFLMSCFGFYDLGKMIFLGQGRYAIAFKIQAIFALAIGASCALSVMLSVQWLPVGMAVLGIPGVVVAMLTYRAGQKRTVFRAFVRVPDLVSYVKFGLPLVISALSVNPALQLFVNTVSGLNATERLALTLALSWTGIVLSLPGMINTTSLSLFLKGAADTRATNLLRILYVAVCLTGAAIAFALSKLSPSLFEVGGHMMDGVVSIVILSSIPMALSLIESSIFLASGKTNSIMYGNAIFFAALAAGWIISLLMPISVHLAAAAIVIAHVLRFATMAILSGMSRSLLK